ncbi:MAG: acyltransferase family protein [Fibrobacter sp.]|nr:acyltransferase family protein [Fibrobacter sp.]
MQRNDKIDIVRGIAICLMVLGHCSCPFTHFVYLFHMAAFYFASGVLYNEEYSLSTKNITLFIRKKIKRLWIPYFFYSTMYLLLWNFFTSINMHKADYISIYELAKNIFFNVFFLGKCTQFGGGLWFLMSLFVVTILYAFIDFVLNMKKVKNKSLVHLLLGCVALELVCLFHYRGINSTTLNQILGPYVIYVVGILFLPRFLAFIERHLFLVFTFSFVGLLICDRIGSIDVGRAELTSPVFFVAASLCGWLFLYAIACYVQINKVVSSFFEYVGQCTIPILGLHFLMFKLVTLLQIKVYDESINFMKSFPTLHTHSIWWLAYFFAGIFFPLCVHFLYKKLMLYVK